MGAILTLDNLMKRGFLLANWCVMCKQNAESCNHLLLWCPVSYELCSMIYKLLGLSWVISVSVKRELLALEGIYIGDGKVIHFTRAAGQEIGTGTALDRFLFSSSPSHPSDNPCPQCGDQTRLEGVICSCVDCFLSGGELYLFEYGVSPALFLVKARGGTCTLATSDPPKDVLRRSYFLLQNGFGGYNIFKNNCEDFSIYCKTGLLVSTSLSVGRSGQAASFVAATSAIVSSPLRFLTTSFSGLAAVSCGMYCISRLVSDIGIRRDVAKVPVERLVAVLAFDESTIVADVAEKDELIKANPIAAKEDESVTEVNITKKDDSVVEAVTS
ncbi:uncharacterized protein LOC110810189 isoform X2 [Carica papaya]|uniref:uncharacterized protein LOC110810189 isoform X2 n=1 Tax=Carica papaya TaxID=3649 RepID=UPI000B8C9092|nr:uncharacterized protein LOC110810189 isoform X2 [Carica papaya]